MSNIIIPFSSVIDSETRAVLNDLKAKLAKAESDAKEWRNQALYFKTEVEAHKKGIERLKAFQESLEPITRELMDFLDICEDDGW